MSRVFAITNALRQRWPWTGFLAASLVGSLVAILVLDWLGINQALDTRLLQVFYQVRGERSSDKSVILVEIDDRSVEAEGPLPWHHERYLELIAAIEEGKPRAIAFVEPSGILWRGDADPSAPGFNNVFIPPLSAPRPELTRYLGGSTVVATLPLHHPAGQKTLFASLLERLDYQDPGHELPINYLGPDAEVPLLSATQVMKDQLRTEVFRDQIVLVGRAHTETTFALPTPAGEMTLPEMYAHALLALEDDATWWHPHGTWRWLLLLFYTLAMAFALYHRTMRTMLYAAIGFGSGFLVLAYIGFTTGSFLVSVAESLCITLVTFAIAVLSTEAEARFRLARLAKNFAEQTRVLDTSLEQLWKDAIHVAQRYTDAHSSMIAEIVPGDHDIHIRATDGVSLDDIAETNRDIQKPPFREPLLAKRFEILNDFMNPDLGLQTIMVPLLVGTESVGFWILNYKTTELPTPALERCIEHYAAQIAHTLADIRLRTKHRPRRGQSMTSSRDYLMSTIDNVRLDARHLVREHRVIKDLTDHLPVGLAIANLWQEIVLVNNHLSKLLSELSIWLTDIRDVSMLISKLTETPLGDAQASLRSVAETGTSRIFAIPRTDYVLTLAWIHVKERGYDAPLARFVLTANRGVAPDKGGGAEGAFDVQMVIMEVLGILRTETTLPQRQIRIELEYPTPRARGDSSVTLAALLIMLRDTATHGDPDMPCMLTVEADDNQIIVSVSDATYSIPESAVEGMLREEGDVEDTQNSLAAIRNKLEETNTGHLDVESMYGSGIMFRLQLPVES